MEPVKGGFVSLNFNRRRMQVSLPGRNPVWVYNPKGRGECVCGCDTGCGINKVSYMESQQLIVRYCSQGLVLISWRFSVWFFLKLIWEIVHWNILTSEIQRMSYLSKMQQKNLPSTVCLFFPPHIKLNCFKDWGRISKIDFLCVIWNCNICNLAGAFLYLVIIVLRSENKFIKFG